MPRKSPFVIRLTDEERAAVEARARRYTAGQWEATLERQLTGESLDRDPDPGGKSSPVAHGEERHRARRDAPRRITCASCRQSVAPALSWKAGSRGKIQERNLPVS